MEKRLSRAFRLHRFTVLALLLLATISAVAQKPATTSPSTVSAAENRTAHTLARARADPLHLCAFLARMPKGADLHTHLTGAVYAESWIRFAAEDNLCVDLVTHSFFQSRAMTDSLPPQPVCGDGNLPAARANQDQHLYDALIDAFSMRSFVPTTGVSGHDHFFDAFAKPYSPRRQAERCGEANPAPACAVQLRYIYQVLRGFPPEQVFAQTLLGFEAALADLRVVGINLVMPEDGYVSMSDYALQMRMVGFLHGVYARVHITLHAGELAPGLVTYEGLSFHVRQAVEVAHAERIGHGVDVMYEERPYELLKEMAAKHVMVELNLSSNDLILGVGGKNHPFPIYRKFGVPVALSTDDEGVSRIDLTHEYVRAVESYALTYSDLKQMSRTGLEHNFRPGPSLWREQDVFTRPVAACSSEFLGA